MKPADFVRPKWMLLLAIVGFCAYLGIQLGGTYISSKRDINRIRHIVASEELILGLTGELRKLSSSVENLRFPDEMAAGLFADQVQVADVRDSVAPAADGNVTDDLRQWSIASSQTLAREQLQLWQTLVDRVDYFDHTKFYFIRGRFPDDSLDSFVSDVGFKGLAKMKDGGLAGVTAKQEVVWQRVVQSDGPQETWKIVQWNQQHLEVQQTSQRLFVESLEQALPDPADLAAARQSEHQQAVVDYYRGEARTIPWRYFAPISANQRPGISVVDIDRDGHDDLYLMVRRGRNQLLRNRGDGTFDEVAAEWGLDIEHYNSCGIFADFDNDGDQDLMLGRSIERSMYLENTGRRFVAREVGQGDNPLPYLVVSMSAADYNGDGLLDVYCSTYRPAVLESIISNEARETEQGADEVSPSDDEAEGGLDSLVQDSVDWPYEFLSADDAKTFVRQQAAAEASQGTSSRILDQVGPPNVLLVNRGQGKFEVAPESRQLALWKNTLQATWADFDDDGDPDLYVANDWSDDNLLRNDGPRGFTDITDELGATEFGFGMGVSWGDYDQDGLQDLYVSNMYSKAGRRITAQIAELNPDYGRSVVGNYLYRNTQDGFKLVSGLEPPAINVAEAGWSWGGQFADFNNDGWLDLYVPCGYFSAPQEFDSQVDL